MTIQRLTVTLAALALAQFAPAAELGAKPPTFAKDVAPIFQEKCQNCHRAGAMAPMSLVTYEEARPWAKAIKQRVVTRNMPPWHLDKTVGIQQFQNDMSLTDEQIRPSRNGWTRARRWAIRRTCRPRSSGRRMMAGSLPSSSASPIS